MAFDNKYSSMRIFSVTLALAIIGFCLADEYYQYDLDQTFSSRHQPVLKLLSKRQAKNINSTIATPPVQEENTTDAQNSTDTTPTTTPSTVNSPTEGLTVQNYNGDNVTVSNVTTDHHRYYNSSTYLNDGLQFWIDFDKENASTHEMLSQSHRRAATVTLSFDFPFYGHWVRNITIATGGFLYTGDYVHSWLAATQYIAPLMANFDTSMSNYSTIKYMDNGTAFSVQWDKVALQDHPEKGNFSFQATLLKSGDIIFSYKDIPINVTDIRDDAHPVKVGVSDAYIIDRTIFFVRRKTIYEYHKVDKKTDGVAKNSSIYFTALPTCVAFSSCDSCVSNDIGFECVWCPMADRCSDGMDRFRQEWLVKGCDKAFVDNSTNCNLPNPTPTPTPPNTEPSIFTSPPSKFPQTSSTFMPVTKPWDDFDPSAIRVTNVTTSATPTIPLAISEARSKSKDASEDPKSNVSSVVGVLFLVAMIVGFGGWIFYAYRNPHTPSGQCFIRYRPSQWRWRSGEAHYTAAAIHM